MAVIIIAKMIFLQIIFAMLDNSKTGNIVQQNDYKHIILLCKSSAKVVTISGDKVVTLYHKNGDRRYYFNDFSICHHFLVTRIKP